MRSVAAWQMKPNKNTHSILQMYVHKCRTFVPFIPQIEDEIREKKNDSTYLFRLNIMKIQYILENSTKNHTIFI